MATDLQQIIDNKLKLTASIGKANSLRDFGGMWKVNGLYLLDGVEKLGCKWGEMVDKHWPVEFDEDAKTRGIEKKILKRNYDFRTLALLPEDIEKADVSLLYDVVLHQDNFQEVLKQVCRLTNKYVVIAQPFFNGNSLPYSATLLQFLPLEIREKIHCEMWSNWMIENYGDTTKLSVDNWMWGQSLQLIIKLMGGYGWKVSEQPEHHKFTIPMENQWEFTGLIFEKI